MKSNFSTPGFLWPLLTLICVILILTGLRIALKNTGWLKSRQLKILLGTTLIIVIWTSLLTILSYKGFFEDFTKLPPRPALAIFIPLPFVLWFAFSKTGSTLLEKVPTHWLIFMQSFRIFVELLLWLGFLANKLPVQMSFEGRNFDVLSGLLALPAGYLLLSRNKNSGKIITAFNIIGLLLLLNILIVALLSMPTPLRYFMNEPSNAIIAQFPFILLPGVLVPIAYSLHIFSLRQISIKRKQQKFYRDKF